MRCKPGLFNFLLKPAGVNKDALRSVSVKRGCAPLARSVYRGRGSNRGSTCTSRGREWDKRRERKRVAGLWALRGRG